MTAVIIPMPEVHRVYVAGPMRSHALFNFPAFDLARDYLNHLGYEAVSPADLDREIGFTPFDKVEDGFMEGAMRRDLTAIASCDAIALLPGWEDSEGVERELAAADWCGLEVWTIDPYEPSVSKHPKVRVKKRVRA